MAALGKAFSGRMALLGALAVVAFALPASPASADGKLSVSISGAGNVRGGSVGAVINCSRDVGDKVESGTCAAVVVDETECDLTRKPPCIRFPATAELNAAAAPGFAFDRWTGACAGQTGPTCSLVMSRDLAATAVFRDATNPIVTLTQPGAGPVAGSMTLAAGASDNVSVSRVEFRVRGALVATDTTAPYTATFDTRTIPDGEAAVQATAVDGSGLSATTSAVKAIIDNTKPALTVNGPNGATFAPGTTQSWTFAATDGTGSGVSQVRCSLVAAGAAPAFDACSAAGAHATSGRPHGAYVFTVRATDKAGNATDVTRTFAIDAVAPETAITSGVQDGATTTATSLTWTMSASEAGATFECRVYPAALTPGAFAPCSSGASHTASGFAPGVYAFEARAIDAVGNIDATPVKRTFTVVAPALSAPGGGGAGGSGASGADGASTPAAGGGGGGQLVATLAFAFRNASARSTKLTRLVVKNAPAGSTVKATCKKRCAKRSLTRKVGASGKVSLARMIKKRLRVNTRITVVISKPGMGSAVKILKIRARKSPKLTSKCQPVGAAKPRAC